MKRAVYIVVIIILCTFPLLLSGCTDDVDPNTIFAAGIKPYETRIAALETARGQLESRIKAVEDNRATTEYVNNKFSQVSAQNMSNYMQKTDMLTDSQISALSDSQITMLKTKLGITGGSSTGGTTTIPTTGQISCSLINAQQWYTFNTQGIIALKITNGKSDARYIRPQITLNVYPATTTPAVLTSATCVVTSNSQGQPPIVFGSAGSGTPITAWATCQQIIFIPTSGGMNSAGQYLLSSGTSMDIYLTININPSYPGLWTVSISCTDVSMTGT